MWTNPLSQEWSCALLSLSSSPYSIHVNDSALYVNCHPFQTLSDSIWSVIQKNRGQRMLKAGTAQSGHRNGGGSICGNLRTLPRSLCQAVRAPGCLVSPGAQGAAQPLPSSEARGAPPCRRVPCSAQGIHSAPC